MNFMKSVRTGWLFSTRRASPSVIGLLVTMLMGAMVSGCEGCSRKLQEKALKEFTLEMCDTQIHKSGPSCRTEVETRFPECVGPVLAKEIDFEAFAECLGFIPPPEMSPPVVVGRCDASAISASISLSLAKGVRWDDSDARSFDGRTLFVSRTPLVTTADLRAIRIEDEDQKRSVVLQMSDDAAKRLGAATEANVGESVVIEINGSEKVSLIMSAVSSTELYMRANGANIEDFCRIR